jgi:hypothetical protein
VVTGLCICISIDSKGSSCSVQLSTQDCSVLSKEEEAGKRDGEREAGISTHNSEATAQAASWRDDPRGRKDSRRAHDKSSLAGQMVKRLDSNRLWPLVAHRLKATNLSEIARGWGIGVAAASGERKRSLSLSRSDTAARGCLDGLNPDRPFCQYTTPAVKLSSTRER